MNIEQIKNTLREFQAENRQKFKNTQAEFKKAVSYKKKKCSSYFWAGVIYDMRTAPKIPKLMFITVGKLVIFVALMVRRVLASLEVLSIPCHLSL